MIAKRFVESIRERNWGTIFLELSVVVLGVFLGIEVSNANTERQERKLQADYAQRIEADLDKIIEAAKAQQQFENRKVEQVKEAIALTREPASERKSLRIGGILTSLAIRRSPNYASPTLSELQNSGRIALFRDPDLRNDLSAYFSMLQYRTEVIARNNEAHVESYVDFMRREGIGMAFAAETVIPASELPEVERPVASVIRQRFGERRIGEDTGLLESPPSDRFWAQLRAALSWRAIASAANDSQLIGLIDEAEAMKDEIERADLD